MLLCLLPFYLNFLFVDHLKEEADRWFSLAVRTTKHCECCGTRQNLTCSHIIRRDHNYTRTSFRNAHCLCFICHRHFTDNPRKFHDWVKTTWAEEYLQTEKWKSLATMAIVPVDWQQRIDISKQIAAGKISLSEARLKDL